MAEQYIGPDHQLEELSVDEMESKAEQPAENQIENQAESKAKAQAEQQQQLVEARQAIAANESAKNPLETLQADQEPAEAPQSHQVSRQLEQIALKRELKNLRRQLPAPQRLLSKVVHQPAIRATSELAAKTLSRPSGLLGGGLLAFAGSLVYLYLAKHIGFRYNYLLFALLFVGGFALGLCLELGVWLATRHRKLD